jgi:small conductance mechanosensitive channel
MTNWPALAIALGVALLVAYAIAHVVARLVLSGLRAILPDEHENALVHRPKAIVQLLVFLTAAVALAFPAMRLAGYDIRLGGSPEALGVSPVEAGRWLLHDGLRIVLIIVTAYALIRIGSAAARRFEQELSTGTGLDVIERAKRARTLSAMVHKTFTAVVSVLAVLMVLIQLDINIMPVLTGAGIAGLAVGFGAQTLVRDIISGFFLILEDQVRVGDVAVVNGQGGVVEAVNLRTIVLRDEEGTVHVVPNGEVKTLSNRSKDFSFYVFSIAVPFESDPEHVITAMRDAAATLLQDPEFQPVILAPLDVYGVDDFQPGQLVIKGRIKTVPTKQWAVGRELRKRIAAVFNERHIQLPVAQMNVTVNDLAALLGATKGGRESFNEDSARR